MMTSPSRTIFFNSLSVYRLQLSPPSEMIRSALRLMGDFFSSCIARITDRKSTRLNSSHSLPAALPIYILQLALGVPAAVIAAIGNDQERLAADGRFLQLVHRQDHGVEQRRAALRLRERKLVLNLLGVAGGW